MSQEEPMETATQAEAAAATTADDTPATGEHIALSNVPEFDSFHPAWSSNNTQTCWAITNIKAPFYEPESRAAVDIVAVIDKSGSMGGGKLELVKKTLLFVIDQLKDTDRISLVTYDTQVELVFGLMKMEKQNKERAKTFVQSLHTGSSTNLCGGLIKGMEQIALTNGGEKAQVQSVLLLTDGHANHWITSKDGIVAEMKKMQDLGLGAVSAEPSSGRHHHHAPPMPWGLAQQAPPPPRMQQQKMAKKKKRAPPAFQQAQKQQVPMPPPPPMQPQPNLIQQAAVPPPPPPPVPQMQQQAPMQMQQAPMLMQQQAPMPPLPPPMPVQQVDAPTREIDPATSGYKFDGTVYTFGFGSDHDATLLEAISTQGGGVYYYIDSNEKIPESFADCLGGLLSVVGQNLSLTLEAVGDYSFDNVHANRMIKWKTPKKCCEIALGDLQSEEERDIVLEISVPPVSLGAKLPVLDDPMFAARLSYFNIITAQMDLAECQLTVTRDYPEEQKKSETKISVERVPNMAVDIQRNRILATAVLKQAEALADQGNMSEAQKVLKDVMTRITQSVSADQDFCKVLMGDLKRCLDSMVTRHSYRSHGKLATVNMIQTHSVQRSNYSDDVVGRYQSTSKAMYRSKVKKGF